jgi:hypothetical protein
MGKVSVSFDTAKPYPYAPVGSQYPGGQVRLTPSVEGPKRLAELFETAGKRIRRRVAQRKRALEYQRPRYRPLPPRLTEDSPVPKGWHLRGTCPDCTEG